MEDYVKKIVLLGDYAVGKTSIRRKFMGKSFVNNYMPTTGADLSHINLGEVLPGKILNLSIWDLAGQKNYNQVRPVYYRGSDAAIIVLDITRQSTLDSISNWVDEFFEAIKNEPPIIIVSNKEDLREERDKIIPLEDVQEYVRNLEEQLNQTIPIYSTSAKTGQNVDILFNDLSEILLKKSE